NVELIELCERKRAHPPARRFTRQCQLRLRRDAVDRDRVRPIIPRHRCAMDEGEPVWRTMRSCGGEVVDELRGGFAAGESDTFELARERGGGDAAVFFRPAKLVPLRELVGVRD